MKKGKKHRFKKRYLILGLLLVALFACWWYHVYENVFLKAAFPEKYSDIVAQYSKESGLDPNLVFAVMRSESSFNPDAISAVGAMGLMQLTPPTFEWAMDKTPEKEIYIDSDLYKPDVNVHYGTIVLSAFIKEFGNEETALAAYHAGRSNVKKWLADKNYSKDGKTLYHIPFADTRAYVKKVEESKKIYAQLYSKSKG
jgi:soluble lytic murein transglycosylase